MKRSILACALILTALTGCAYRKNIRLGDELVARGDYPAAIASYRRAANDPFGSGSDARLKIEEASARWAADLSRRAGDIERQGHTGAAWLLAAKANGLAPRQAAYSEQARALRARLTKAADYPVALEASDARARSVLGEIEKRMPADCALRRALDGERPKATFRLAIGDVAFETKTSRLEKTAAYKSGVRTVPNPEFDQRRAALEALRGRLNREADREVELRRTFDRREAEYGRALAESRHERRDASDRERQQQRDELRRLEKRSNEARRDWENTHDRRAATERDIERVGRELGATPPHIEENVMAEHRFPATVLSLTARARLVATVDHADGRPRIEATEELTAEDRAESHAAQPIAGVAEQYTAPPSAQRVAARLPGIAVHPAARAIQQSFEGYRAMLLRQADEAPTDAERLDRLALYVVSSPRNVGGEVAARIDQTALGFAQIEGAAGLMINAR